MTTTYTQTFRFPKPDFRSPDWAPQIQSALDGIDKAIRNAGEEIEVWDNAVAFEQGMVAIDTDDSPSTFWICATDHTSAIAPTTFAADRLAHPTYWTPYSFGIQPRGAWANNTVYAINDIAYDSALGITGVCNTAHTSNLAGTIVDDAANWDFIVNLPTVFTAVATSYDNGASGLTASNVQDAIDEIAANVDGAYDSANTDYDPTSSGMTATNVQDAIDELDGRLDDAEADITQLQADVVAGTIATGFIQWRPTNETLSGWTVMNATTIGSGASAATQRANDDTLGQFTYLWDKFSNTECPVSGGRGINAAADFAANKTITVLDFKGTFGGLGVDTMGGSATTRLSSVPVTSGSATTASSVLGENLHTLVAAEHASHFHGVFAGVETHQHNISSATGGINVIRGDAAGGAFSFAAGGFGAVTVTATAAVATGLTVRDTAAGAGTANQTAAQGSGTAHNTVPRAKTGYWYMKL